MAHRQKQYLHPAGHCPIPTPSPGRLDLFCPVLQEAPGLQLALMALCLSTSLHLCLYHYLSLSLSVSVSVFLYVSLFLSLFFPACNCLHLFVHVSVCLSLCLPVSLWPLTIHLTPLWRLWPSQVARFIVIGSGLMEPPSIACVPKKVCVFLKAEPETRPWEVELGSRNKVAGQ